MESHSLYEVNEFIRRVVALNFPDAIWIHAEIGQVKESRGQVYLELVQLDENQEEIVARAQAAIWYKSFLFIKSKLKDLTYQILQDGNEVKLKVKLEHHEKYGLKFVVTDIDAAYTFGQKELSRQKIIEKLQKENLFYKNKETILPLALHKIAVISSQTAAGFQDFKEQLNSNKYGYHFDVRLFPAAMQGTQLEKEVLAALHLIKESDEDFDCVCIMRGGGSKLDLSSFDSYKLAVAIAEFPQPVFTGIGHDIDQTILDMVSYESLKTPTALADHIIDHNVDFEVELIGKLKRVQDRVLFIFKDAEWQLASKLEWIKARPKEIIRAKLQTLDSLKERMDVVLTHRLKETKSKLATAHQHLELLNPERILKRGFSITRINNKSIKSSQKLKAGDVIETHLHDGKIESTVN